MRGPVGRGSGGASSMSKSDGHSLGWPKEKALSRAWRTELSLLLVWGAAGRKARRIWGMDGTEVMGGGPRSGCSSCCDGAEA
jgi:hypothetical protein